MQQKCMGYLLMLQIIGHGNNVPMNNKVDTNP